VGEQGGDDNGRGDFAAPWADAAAGLLPLLFRWWPPDAPASSGPGERRPDRLGRRVAGGRRVVLLCEGDVSLSLPAPPMPCWPWRPRRSPQLSGCACPGHPPRGAAAGGAHWPLALQQQGLLVANTPESARGLRRPCSSAAGATPEQRANLVLLKLGPAWSWGEAAAGPPPAAGGLPGWPGPGLAR